MINENEPNFQFIFHMKKETIQNCKFQIRVFVRQFPIQLMMKLNLKCNKSIVTALITVFEKNCGFIIRQKRVNLAKVDGLKFN